MLPDLAAVPLGERLSEPHDLRVAKRGEFIAAARRALFANGYGATSMSSIAATVGGSKTTLWSHFRSKHEIFGAVVDDIVERYASALAIELSPDAPLAATLERYGIALLTTVFSAPIVDLHRMVIGEAGRFPELATVFWERGPRLGKARLSAYLAGAMANDRMREGDPMRAALQFVALCQAERKQQVILGLAPAPDAATIAADVAVAVNAFLKIWAESAPLPVSSPEQKCEEEQPT